MTESTEERSIEAKDSVTIVICGSPGSGKIARPKELKLLEERLERSGFALYVEEEEKSEFDSQLDDIFTELHAADDRITKDCEDIVLLGKETRTILSDLRKQLG